MFDSPLRQARFPKPSTVVGPYSLWPRQMTWKDRKNVVVAASGGN